MKSTTCNLPDSIHKALQERMESDKESCGHLGPALHKAFEVQGPALIGIRVDYRDNHLLFDQAREHLFN